MTAGAPSRRLIFLHIPKTGGATLQTIIVRDVPPSSVHLQRVRPPARPPARGPRLPTEGAGLTRAERERREFEGYAEGDLARILVVIGHYLYGVHEALPGPSTYVTLLRHPVDRVISLYHYRRTTEGLTASIDEYVASDPDLDLDDGQTTAIGGAIPSRPRNADEMSRLLERAKQHLLRSFAVVGVTERFDETVALIGRTFGWRRLAYVPRNVGRGRPGMDELPADTIERILDRNRFDAALYGFARQLMERRLAETDPPIEDDVRRLRRLNRLHRRAPVALRAADRVARIRVEAARRGATRSPRA